jgi:hypothetical protein
MSTTSPLSISPPRRLAALYAHFVAALYRHLPRVLQFLQLGIAQARRIAIPFEIRLHEHAEVFAAQFMGSDAKFWESRPQKAFLICSPDMDTSISFH